MSGAGHQAIRHEHLSTLLIALPSVHQQLDSIGIDVSLIMSVVLTHHLKAGSRITALAARLPDGSNQFHLLVEPELQSVLDLGAEIGMPTINSADFPRKWCFGFGQNRVEDHANRLHPVLHQFTVAIRRDESRRRMLVALRAALIGADGAGSGLVRQGHSIVEWVRRNVTEGEALTRDWVYHEIINPRVDDLKRAGKWKDGWSSFQTACDAIGDRALLLAPCGSGKTLAAWRWIAAQLERHPARHVLFLYPTRATAREGFKDYVSWAPEGDARLMHGTSEFDLDGMFENPPEGDDRHTKSFEVERRLFALAYWSGRAFSATVDQFLAFMQHGYGPLCMLPVLVDSVVVIDEVHSFDKNMFAALKDFLKTFRVPVLCMTATLPGGKREQLVRDCGLSPSPAWPEDLQAVAEQPRYRVRQVADSSQAIQQVREALSQKKTGAVGCQSSQTSAPHPA